MLIELLKMSEEAGGEVEEEEDSKNAMNPKTTATKLNTTNEFLNTKQKCFWFREQHHFFV